ncbi:surfactant protein Bb [Brachionichthys hirsutus]|uniref:surfactant protein Bb n=1 Tax=Brachionichthys hirsutus TaxID=412623 RepID=UPI0036050307
MSVSGFILAVLAVSLWPGESGLVIDASSLAKRKSLDSDTCLECSQIVQLSANMISSRDAKETVYEALHALCQRLPNEQASECDSHMNMYLPKVLQQASGHLNPEETCVAFGLCAADKEEKPLELPRQATSGVPSSSPLGTDNVQEMFNPACTLCLYIMRKLETLLPTNVTEEALMKLMGEVCYLIPHSYEKQCDDFVAKYGTEIVEFLLSSAAPQTICVLLHVCLFKEQTPPDASLPSECQACRTLAVLSQLYLGPNSTETETSSFFRSVCVRHPSAIPKCEAFVKVFGDRLKNSFGDQMGGARACERADLCVASRTLEPLGRNPCTWGPGYWCKDIHAAQKCGNQAFCKKYVWKN